MFSPRILIVEDQEFQREYLKNIFLSLGLDLSHVSSAENGEDAIKIIEESNFDLVISDLMMPDLDGVQLIQRLALLEQPPILAIISSASRQIISGASMVARAHGLIVLENISKPARVASICKLLENLKKTLDSNVKKCHSGLFLAEKPAIEEIINGLGNNEFCAWFQPKTSLIDGCIYAAEALVRWNHPTKGILRPIMFMDKIIEAGLEEKLLWLILENSINIQRVWKKQGFKIKVAINLPTNLLDSDNFPDRVYDFVINQGGSPSDIVLELLESTRAEAITRYYAGTCRLRMRGFGLAQDDFGQGYSSMHNLVSTPFTELKIDRSLVYGCFNDKGLAAALTSIIKLGRKLGLEIVAEGVEHPDEIALLKSLNCDYVQGYLISEPVPHDVFFRLLQDGSFLSRS